MIRKNKIKEKLARKLKKKLSKKQRTNKVKNTDRFQKIIVPVIEHVTPYKLETLSLTMRAGLRNFVTFRKM